VADAPSQVWMEETNGRLEARSTSTSDAFAEVSASAIIRGVLLGNDR